MTTAEKQEKFLEVLFTDEAKGNIRSAMRIAGYSDSYPTSALIEVLKDRIAERTKLFISATSAQALYTLQEALSDPNVPLIGLKERIAVARDLLDRGGHGKTEQIEIKAANPLFILPAKESDDE